jgi:uncharacterized protein (UPF0212 family)
VELAEFPIHLLKKCKEMNFVGVDINNFGCPVCNHDKNFSMQTVPQHIILSTQSNYYIILKQKI